MGATQFPRDPNQTVPDASTTQDYPAIYADQTAISAPPPPQSAKPKRHLARNIFIGFVVVLLLFGGAALYALKVTPQGGAFASAYSFCNAMKNQQYTQAYSYLSPDMQKQISSGAFTNISQTADSVEGKVTGCTLNNVSAQGSIVNVQSTITRSKMGSETVTIQMINNNGSWQINSSPDPKLLPIATVYQFCADIKYQQYDAAYQLLSPNFQAAVTSTGQFQQIFTGLQNVAGTFVNCQDQQAGIDSSKGIATIYGTISFTRLQNIPITINETDTTGVWLIDSLIIDILNNPVQFPSGS